MSSNASRSLEAWLVLAGMLAALAWYARAQLGYSLQALWLALGWIVSASAG